MSLLVWCRSIVCLGLSVHNLWLNWDSVVFIDRRQQASAGWCADDVVSFCVMKLCNNRHSPSAFGLFLFRLHYRHFLSGHSEIMALAELECSSISGNWRTNKASCVFTFSFLTSIFFISSGCSLYTFDLRIELKGNVEIYKSHQTVNKLTLEPTVYWLGGSPSKHLRLNFSSVFRVLLITGDTRQTQQGQVAAHRAWSG